jgi:uncharacterized protein with von Willebrand factor type A (vWA) domain
MLTPQPAQRLAGFCTFLHANGFALGAGDAAEVLHVATRVGVLDRDLLRTSLRALLCGRCDEWRRFGALFDAWFLPPDRWSAPELRDVSAGRSEAVPGSDPASGDPDDAGRGDTRAIASARERLARIDFRDLLPREHTLEIEALMRTFARRLKPLRLRRQARSWHGKRLDLRTTIRRSIASGGTPFELAWHDHRQVLPRLVLLLDASRSMAAYGFFYLRLARALSAELADLHCFIFHTRVSGVSEALRDPDPWRAQERLQLLAQGWGGGTRIGECLAAFAREHAPRLVHARTAIVILSDGYDSGDPALLAQSLAALRRRARRIAWINPLCSRPGYAPVSRGMQAALPHLDLLAPGADLRSIAAVLPRLLENLR